MLPSYGSVLIVQRIWRRLILIAFCFGSNVDASGYQYVASVNDLNNPVPQSRAFRLVTFSESGEYQGVIREYPPHLRPLHLTSTSEFIFAAVYSGITTTYHMEKLAPDGSLVEQFPLPGVNCCDSLPISVESDARGNIYVQAGAMIQRYSSHGELELTIPTQGTFGGTDADADGRIWVSQYPDLRWYDAYGIPLGSLPNPRMWEGNVVIDESRSRLYQGFQPGGIEVYDFTSTPPVLSASFSTAEVHTLKFNAYADTLLVGSPILAPIYYEYNTQGSLRHLFVLPPGVSGTQILDMTVVPEPVGTMIRWILAVGCLASMRKMDCGQ